MSKRDAARKADGDRRIRGIDDDGEMTDGAAGGRRRKCDIKCYHLSGRDDLPVRDAGGREAGAGNCDARDGDIDAAGIREVHTEETAIANDHIAEAEAGHIRSERARGGSIDGERWRIDGGATGRIPHDHVKLGATVGSGFRRSGVTRRSRTADGGAVFLPLVAKGGRTRSTY